MQQSVSPILYAGVNDRELDLFESHYRIPHGVSYNSYIIIDEKIAVTDAVDARFVKTWLSQIDTLLKGRAPDYLIVHHMEPDHSAGISAFMDKYPRAVVMSSAKSFAMMKQFFNQDYADRRVQVTDGDELCLGEKKLSFITAPMVHWPEVLMSYLSGVGALFSADAFGKFGTLDTREPWDDEARRYYIGIVGKYGAQVQAVLKKVAALSIRLICPLHGPALEGDLSHYLDLYDKWSRYECEERGVAVAYTSVYGHTREAAEKLAESLRISGETVSLYDLSRDDMAAAVADAFRYDRLVLATTTYNMEIFPPMREFLSELAERGFKNRTVGLIENGTWAPAAAKKMVEKLSELKDIRILEPTVTIRSSLDGQSEATLQALTSALKSE
ncbi:MAG: FprA family A-type flavoprotein [Clostridia bacterium]|nr:FprA family A-type flavoprotein [Clostridia bacterium]